MIELLFYRLNNSYTQWQQKAPIAVMQLSLSYYNKGSPDRISPILYIHSRRLADLMWTYPRIQKWVAAITGLPILYILVVQFKRILFDRHNSPQWITLQRSTPSNKYSKSWIKQRTRSSRLSYPVHEVSACGTFNSWHLTLSPSWFIILNCLWPIDLISFTIVKNLKLTTRISNLFKFNIYCSNIKIKAWISS